MLPFETPKVHKFRFRTCNKDRPYYCSTSQRWGHGKIHYCTKLTQNNNDKQPKYLRTNFQNSKES